MMRSRVVVTGVGAVSAFGLGVEATRAGLASGRSAIGDISLFDASGFAAKFGGEVPALDIKPVVPKGYRKASKIMARDSQLAVVAAQLAARDAALLTRGSGEAGDLAVPPDAHRIDGRRAGCQIGAGLIAAETKEITTAVVTAVNHDGIFDTRLWGTEDGSPGGMNNLPPLWMLKYLPNMLACHVTIIHGLEGPSNTITCAEPSGLLSLGEASRVIERGSADVCFAGGIESKLNPMGLARLTLAHRLADASGLDALDAWTVIRPYDPTASGGLVGEGGAILSLESADYASARGAEPYAGITGFGSGQSTAHVFAGSLEPAPNEYVDRGLERAVRAALRDAGIEAGDIDAVVPGALGARAADLGEANALREVFGSRLRDVPLVVLPPLVGVMAAGTGAFQAAVAAIMIKDQRIPSQVHAGEPVAWLDAGRRDGREARLRHVLVCSTGLGGQSAALVYSVPGTRGETT